MLKPLIKHFFKFGLLITIAACSKSENNELCGPSSMIISENHVCLSIENNQLSNEQKNIVEGKIRSGINTINSALTIDNLLIRIVQNSQLVIPEIGIGGYNPNLQEVIIAIDHNFIDLEGAIEEYLIPTLAHEIHHAKRRRSIGYGNTLLQACVSEGLADHFSIEVTGIEPPPWSVALTGNELENWIDIASDSWNSSYNHSRWFLGTDPNIPRWTGYAIGFELVKNYLLANPDKQPSDLQDEPASSFLP